MTFEERIDRLTERHEALTQTVELLARLFLDHEKRFQAHEQSFNERAGKMMEMITVDREYHEDTHHPRRALRNCGGAGGGDRPGKVP